MVNCFSHVWLFGTLWTVASQAPLSIGFSRQEYWSGLPCTPPKGLPNSGIKPGLLCLLQWQVGSLPLPPGKPCICMYPLFYIPIQAIQNTNRVHYAIEQVLIIYLFYILWFDYVNPSFPIYLPPFFPCSKFFSTSLSLLLFCK